MDDVTASSNIITIIELTGLKFSSNSFHMNYCLRQVMVLEEKPIFNKCLINFSGNKNVIKKQTTTNVDNNNEGKKLQEKDLEKNTENTNEKESTSENVKMKMVRHKHTHCETRNKHYLHKQRHTYTNQSVLKD